MAGGIGLGAASLGSLEKNVLPSFRVAQDVVHTFSGDPSLTYTRTKDWIRLLEARNQLADAVAIIKKRISDTSFVADLDLTKKIIRVLWINKNYGLAYELHKTVRKAEQRLEIPVNLNKELLKRISCAEQDLSQASLRRRVFKVWESVINGKSHLKLGLVLASMTSFLEHESLSVIDRYKTFATFARLLQALSQEANNNTTFKLRLANSVKDINEIFETTNQAVAFLLEDAPFQSRQHESEEINAKKIDIFGFLDTTVLHEEKLSPIERLYYLMEHLGPNSLTSQQSHYNLKLAIADELCIQAMSLSSELRKEGMLYFYARGWQIIVSAYMTKLDSYNRPNKERLNGLSRIAKSFSALVIAMEAVKEDFQAPPELFSYAAQVSNNIWRNMKLDLEAAFLDHLDSWPENIKSFPKFKEIRSSF